ncbi:hypothetical protein TCAL_13099 [Tigriopus californicus]|uniref:Poly(A)-specific ribonuclease PARN n=2 Tax=Tigriopus californicus TaxID=6832 RepID=A0A553PPW0_TIGCA|nr:hypothetical protein TCAL_13099 [Tigriopus californicus]|eukprot:TCALIF_13099-PA protein Name:"Similar to parn Poly(A)-specific ribonuclease PARN (Xenopus laevis)" AED:0.01 eAED:0.01 QI:0/-1/0/1/-1/1/1/0/571
MEVTAQNFKAVLPMVEKAIDEAQFVAIDGEFTGLNLVKPVSALDLPLERYDALRESSRQFLLVQFGLCTFHYDSKKDLYTNRAFNFYVWPRPYTRNAPDLRFMCQTSSIDFLVKQDFDFNKLFKHGISYLKPEAEEKMKKAIEDRQITRKSNDTPNAQHIPIPEAMETYINEIKTKIQTFIQGNSNTLFLEKSNAFQRRLIYQVAREEFTGIFLESVAVGRDRVIKITKMDANEHAQKDLDRNQSEFDVLDEAVGFAKVIQKLSQSRKPVVGHNMFLDLCYTLNQFVCTLPESYSEFKHLANKTFPILVDTKTMATQYPFRDEIFNSSLEELKNTLMTAPFHMPDVKAVSVDSGYELESEKYHEAGYDAFITGLCFIAMSNHLGTLSKELGPKPRLMPDSPLLKPFFNKIHLMRIADIPYMNLAGEDISPNRDHVFHVTFPSEWKTSDLVNLFSAFGNVQVSWLNESSAYVSLYDPTSAKEVLSALNCSSVYNIMTYGQFKSFEASASLTGITPTLAQSKLSFSDSVSELKELTKKRSISPDPEPYKRSKSVTDDDTPVQTSKNFAESSDW